MTLLEQITATAGEREAITRRWHGQLAALAELSGGAAPAAQLSGLPKADIETAVKRADRADVTAILEAAKPTTRRRRKPAGGVPPAIVWPATARPLRRRRRRGDGGE
jgi:hypothetical protein